MFKIIQNRKYWFSLSGILVVLSIVFILIWGLKLGIDFTGGSLLEIEFSNTRPSNEEIDTKLSDLELTTLNLQPSNELGLIIRTESVTEEKHQAILNKLNELFIDSDLNENNEEGISDNLEIEGGFQGVDDFLQNQFDVRLENLLISKNSSIHHLESAMKNKIIQKKQLIFKKISEQYKN